MDKLIIKDLPLWCSLGITEGERAQKQPLHIDISLALDLRPAGEADDLSRSIDYRDVCKVVNEIARTEYHTIEALAERLAEGIRKRFPAAVSITLKKPAALKKYGARYAAVSITR